VSEAVEWNYLVQNRADWRAVYKWWGNSWLAEVLLPSTGLVHDWVSALIQIILYITHSLCPALVWRSFVLGVFPSRNLANLQYFLICAVMFALTPFGCLHSITPTPYLWWEYYFLFAPTLSRTQLGRKTRADCLYNYSFLTPKLSLVLWRDRVHIWAQRLAILFHTFHSFPQSL
jgi:hypothetical protein